MKLFTASQMQKMDNTAILEQGIPSLTLMRAAARHVVRAAEEMAKNNRRAAILAGTGNNGGDGFAAGHMLLRDGWQVRLFLTGQPEKMTNDCRAMAEEFTACGGIIEPFTGETEDIRTYLDACGVIIDALFGVGLHSPLRAPSDEAVRMANRSAAPILAVDVPSGIMADTGAVMGEAIRARHTVTFSYAKPGLVSEPGCYAAGEVSVCDIGIPASVRDLFDTDITTPEADEYRLPVRPRGGYKSTFGRDLIIAGSVGYTGAPVLAAEAAVRCGAGLVFLGVPQDIYTVAAVKCTSAMPFPLPSDGGITALAAWEQIRPRLDSCDVCLVGPGLGRSEEATALVQRIVTHSKVPLVIDADGLYALAQNIDVLDKAACPVILTPHEGEFIRLGGRTDCDRLTAAREFAEKHRCTLVYKGHRTITAFSDSRTVINTTGNPGMGKGGSGDVLAGMIAAFVGQGMDIAFAVPAAVYYHGAAGDDCAARMGEYAMTPTDMTEALCRILKQ